MEVVGRVYAYAGLAQGKAYMFMMRTKQPAGVVSNQLYLTMDDLADQVRRLCGACVPVLQPQQSIKRRACVLGLDHGEEA